MIIVFLFTSNVLVHIATVNGGPNASPDMIPFSLRGLDTTKIEVHPSEIFSPMAYTQGLGKGTA